MLSKPILVVGAARSGTHLLASTINRNFDVAYTGEVNELWKRYVPASRTDLIPAPCATSPVIRRLREDFRRISLERGGKRILEKTPANTLRLPFVTRVFPDAVIIHVLRDGRDVALSARKQYRGDYRKITKIDDSRIGMQERVNILFRTATRKRRNGMGAKALFSNFSRYWNGALSLLELRAETMWGPRFPGFEECYRRYSTLEVAALQWRTSVECAQNFIASRPDLPVCEVHYEDLIASPEEVLRDVFEFIATNDCPSPEEIHHNVIDGGKGWREQLSLNEKQALSEHIESVLISLGYERTFQYTAGTGPS